MNHNEKRDVQLNSLIKLLNQIGPVVDKAQDEEWEAKGWQKGFAEFFKVLEQVHYKAGYKQGFKEGVERYQKDLMGEIAFQKDKYAKLTEEGSENKSDTHPDIRTEIMKIRTQKDNSNNVTARKTKLRAKKQTIKDELKD